MSRLIQRCGRGLLGLAAGGLLVACGGDGGSDDNSTPKHVLGVTVSGLVQGKSLVLQNNKGDDLTVSANGEATFATALAHGSTYSVTVKTQPSDQTCDMTGAATGTLVADGLRLPVVCKTGGSSNPGETPPDISTTALTGTWIQTLCSGYMGMGARNFIRVTPTGEQGVRQEQGVVTYTDAACTKGAVFGSTIDVGPVTFYKTQSMAGVSARWGAQHIYRGDWRVIWARLGVDKLCILGDETPSILPTVESVAAHLKATTLQSCYVNQPL